jgi:hypothetical protein
MAKVQLQGGERTGAVLLVSMCTILSQSPKATVQNLWCLGGGSYENVLKLREMMKAQLCEYTKIC